MATLMQNPSQLSNAPLPPDLEPDEEWKQTLKVNIEAGLRSMVDEAKQKLSDELAKGIVSPEERERLTTDHLATLKTIRQLAEEQFRIALERERQERRWASGEQLDRAWSESMMKEQQAILDRIERERKNKAPVPASVSPPSLRADVPQVPPPPIPPKPPVEFLTKPDALLESTVLTSLSPNRKIERATRAPIQIAEPEREGGPYFSRPVNHERDELAASPDEFPQFRTGKNRAGSITSMGSWKAPSVLDTEKSFLERSKPLPMHDESESMARSARTPTDPLDPTRKDSIRRKPSMTVRPIVQEIWKPSITPEEDAQMSRTFTLARRSSTASATSSFKAPSVLSAAFTDPLDVLSGNVDRERASIHSADQEWTSMDRARERDRERERTSYIHGDDRSVYSSTRGFDDRVGFSQLSTTSPTTATNARASDNARVHIPPPSASRPIVNKKSFTLDDTFPQSSPNSRYWNSVSRSPLEARWEGSSRSPQTPEDVARSCQSSQLRARFSSQDMRHYFQQEGSHYGSRPVHIHHENFEEDGSDDGYGFDNRSWRIRDYNERRIQDIEEGLRRREEAANKREEELARKAEELKREDEDRKKRLEEQRREEELRTLEEDIKQREDDEAERKEAELRRKEEEANRKEREAAMREEEVKRKEQEARMKEQEAKKKEREARAKEEEAKKKEKEARSREMEAKRKEEEVKKKEREANSREMEARRKQEEVRIMEEEARRREFEATRKQEEAERKEQEARRRAEEASLKAEETRKKEEELRKREDELRRREEDLNRREVEMRRREDDRLQDEFRKREEEIRRQRAEERKKQEVWETWPPETFRPTPSPQTPSPQAPNSSGPWPIPNRNDRGPPAATSPPFDRVSSSASGRSNPLSGWSSASTRPSSTAATQSSSTPKPTGPATPTPKPPTSNAPNPPLTEAEFHRRQAEQAQLREEQFRREQARMAMQEHERQAKTGKTMSKEEVTKLFESHRNQWDKIQTMSSLIWEDFPWPMYKRPKGPDDLTSSAITSYMLSPIHPQDRATKERIKDSIRRWHPDRFNSQLLPKVKESERERVSEGAGSVARILNDLLRTHSQDTF